MYYIVISKAIIMPSFPHPFVVSNLYISFFPVCNIKEYILKNVGNQTVVRPN